ncbi:hemerythrin domain-containing protein [Paraglaciecola aquimarina]|uniref:Hemerythrin domain-containing protein n=1 Tax=Paraglaciecola algarum TaxID=3050085 RepID=A0ABS9D589_9ALTE|nr:hemerythrin domain-containing protein [Paraglaciecola sp. G1-23]MCF2947839.1 hemerythrin domain-containing protein [Paraglaciecola sp. G1-23]
MNIFNALKVDHEKQRLLMSALLETKAGSPNREEFFKDLKQNLAEHAIAEERYFYVPLIKTDQTVTVSRHGIAEHHDIDKLVAKLENTELSSPIWLKVMKELQHKVLHHLEEEELRFFQQAGKVLDQKQKLELADEYTAYMQAS